MKNQLSSSTIHPLIVVWAHVCCFSVHTQKLVGKKEKIKLLHNAHGIEKMMANQIR
jgi:hypothetical protein